MDNSFSVWKICNIMSKDGTAILTLASGNSNLYTQNWSLLSFLEIWNKDIWPGSFSMSRCLNICRKGTRDKNLPPQHLTLVYDSKWHFLQWTEDWRVGCHQSSTIPYSARKAPIRTELGWKYPLSHASHKGSWLSLEEAPGALLCSLFSDQERHSSCGFCFVLGFFCCFVGFFNWKHFLAKQEWFM